MELLETTTSCNILNIHTTKQLTLSTTLTFAPDVIKHSTTEP